MAEVKETKVEVKVCESKGSAKIKEKWRVARYFFVAFPPRI